MTTVVFFSMLKLVHFLPVALISSTFLFDIIVSRNDDKDHVFCSWSYWRIDRSSKNVLVSVNTQ